MNIIEFYRNADNEVVMEKFFAGLKDDAVKYCIYMHLRRLMLGIGEEEYPVDGDIFELRIPAKPVHIVYYAKHDEGILVLSCIGVKNSQKREIDNAKKYLKEWQERKNTIDMIDAMAVMTIRTGSIAAEMDYICMHGDETDLEMFLNIIRRLYEVKRLIIGTRNL